MADTSDLEVTITTLESKPRSYKRMILEPFESGSITFQSAIKVAEAIKNKKTKDAGKPARVFRNERLSSLDASIFKTAPQLVEADAAVTMAVANYDRHVFVNCPFDKEYKDMFDAIIFAVHDCGYIPRCALESNNGLETRIDKLVRIISHSKLSIHDISRTELDTKNNLPRFNMPLELGIFIGCNRFGRRQHRDKLCLIMDKEPYRYQKFMSDISGQDIYSHDNEVSKAIETIRDWLRAQDDTSISMPSGETIIKHYKLFLDDLPETCRKHGINPNRIPYPDYITLATGWLAAHP